MTLEVKTAHFWRGTFAEFLATMIFVLVSCGAVLPWGEQLRTEQKAAAFGLAMAAVVQCVGYSSGGHVNPAVTGAFVFTGKITWLRALFYIIAQTSGGITGAAILYAITPEKFRGDLGRTLLHPDVTIGQAIGVEAILTFLVVLTVFSATDTTRKTNDYGTSPLVIGIAYFVVHLMGIRYTGCSVNPARSFGPAVVMNEYKHQWIYWTGPMLAGIFAGLVYELLLRTSIDSRSYQLSPREFNVNCCSVRSSDDVKEQVGNYPTESLSGAKYKKRDNGFDDILNLNNATDGGMYKI